MKRRGARIVSSSSAVVPGTDAIIPTPAAAQAVETTATASPSSLLTVVSAAPQPALTIPTLNIFARFQSHRDDFDPDWLLLKEDSSTGEQKPPLAAHVAEKLRRHQAQLGAHRAAAAADRSVVAAVARQGTQASTAKAVSGGNAAGGHALVSGLDDGEGVGPVGAPPRRQRRPDTYDSADDEVSTSTPPVNSAADADDAAVVVVEGEKADDDDDDEYVPEDRKAAQYRRKKATPSEPSDQAEQSPASTPLVVNGNAGLAPTVADGAKKEEVEEGITGDYLIFQSNTLTGAKAVGTDELQATVRMPAASLTFPVSSTGRGVQQQQQRKQSSRRQRGDCAAGQMAIVPLWSTARMEQHGGYCRTSPLIALHQEITDLVDYLRPTEAEVTMRRYIEMEIGKLVDRLWPGSRVLVYGSMYTHLLLPLSDLDMTLLDVPVPAEEALTALAKAISNEGLCENAYPQVILKTKVPLIKFTHKNSLIDVDISVGATDGKRNSDCVIRYLNTYPEALPLVMTVKYFLMQRGMHEPYHGGLGSYAATLLVVAFLRQHPIYTTNPEQRPMTGLGKLLVDFLRMCGQFWNYARVAVSLDDLQRNTSGTDGGDAGGRSLDSGDFHVRSDLEWGSRLPSPVSLSSPRTPVGPAQGTIADPVDVANNAASSLRLFHSVASMFTFAYLALTADFDSATSATGLDSGAPVSSPSTEDISRRPTLLSRIFHVDADMIFHRQAIATTYERLCTEMPSYMDDVRRFHREDDAAMLPSNALSWRKRRRQRRGEAAPFLWEQQQQQQQRSVASLEERLALAHLHGVASPSAADTATLQDEHGSSNSGISWKRLRQDSTNDEDIRNGPAQDSGRRAGQRARAESSTSGSSSSSRSGYDSDTESNASSVRVDVSRKTERSRQMRHS